MLETTLIVLGVLAAVIVILVIVIAIQPVDFRITRSGAMSASPSEAFAQVNDFHNWDAWSPWAKIDPAMKQTYEGAAAGVGAVYSWVGNSNVGEGTMTIMESQPHERIKIKLEFRKPFKATNAAEFTFKAEGDQTIVTWTMTGQKNFFTKAFGLVMSMDKMVGGMFEQGLAQMKAVVDAKKVTASK
jgi:Polyketide cyclase / dehydrase and lipid transport